MSKKHNPRKSQQRRAERRNRNTAKRRAKRSRRTIDIVDGVQVLAGPDVSMETHIAYIEAHRLLPPEYPFSPAEARTQLALALCTLDDPRATSEALLRAILILAHIPDPRALEALQRHARVGTQLRDMAKLGAEECAGWLHDVGSAGPTITARALN